jgi:hypothetical protein
VPGTGRPEKAKHPKHKPAGRGLPACAPLVASVVVSVTVETEKRPSLTVTLTPPAGAPPAKLTFPAMVPLAGASVKASPRSCCPFLSGTDKIWLA